MINILIILYFNYNLVNVYDFQFILVLSND